MKAQKQPTAAAATTPAIYDVAPSQNWSRAMPPGPDRRVKITKEYAKHIARDAFFGLGLCSIFITDVFTRRN